MSTDLPELHNALIAQVSPDPVIRVLYDRLLWLRNHYDLVDHMPKDVQGQVLADVDRVLNTLAPHEGWRLRVQS